MLPHRLTLGSNRKQNIISLAFELRKERFSTAQSVFEMTNQHPLHRELTDAQTDSIQTKDALVTIFV